MTFLVPFDGSDLSAAALVRATEFSTLLEADVLVVTVVPSGNVEYARDRDWLEEGEPFDLETVAGRLADRVAELSPEAEYRTETVSRYTQAGGIAKRIRKTAWDVDATMVFVGSENAGRVVSTVGSVGRSVVTDDTYDVVIVRHPAPSGTANRAGGALEGASPDDVYD